MSVATTLTAALVAPRDSNGPPPSKEERRRLATQHFARMKEADKFAKVGVCASTGKEVTICYNARGNPSNPCLLLVQGLGTSLAGWPEVMLDHFVSQGFYVVCYDNRDVGRSTHFEQFGQPNILRFALPAWASLGEKQIYTLEDMMEDGVGLMRALGIVKFHVFGMSMGGMLVSLMAIHHPDKVLSLSIFCSSLGGRDEVKPGLATYVRFIIPPKSRSLPDQAQSMIRIVHFLSQGQYRSEGDMEAMTDYIEAGYNRDGPPDAFGHVRQIAAIMRSKSRREGLAKVSVPTVVIHGVLDPLIPVENGKRIAQAVSGAKLVLFPRLGHDLPDAIQLDLAAEVVLNMRCA